MKQLLPPDYTRDDETHNTLSSWQPTILPLLPSPTVGRRDAIEALAAAFTAARSVCISGIEGSGKRTLWKMYAHQYAARYPGGVIAAHIGAHYNPATNGVCHLADWLLQALDEEALPMGFIVEPRMVRAFWHSAPAMLVILEEVWDIADIADLLSALPDHAHVVVTTQSATVPAMTGVPVITVGAFEEREALHLLAMALGQDPSAVAGWQWPRRIAQSVAYHPAAWALVCQGMRRAGTTEHVWEQTAALLLDAPLDTLMSVLLSLAVREKLPDTADSIPVLHAIEHQLLLSIACGAQGLPVSNEILSMVWNLPPARLQGSLLQLCSAGLLTQESAQTWMLHPWIRALVRNNVPRPAALDVMTVRFYDALRELLDLRIEGAEYDLPAVLYGQISEMIRTASVSMPRHALGVIDRMADFNRAVAAHDEQLVWIRRLMDNPDPEIAREAALVCAASLTSHAAHVGVDRAALLREALALYQTHAAPRPDGSVPPEILNDWAICALECAELPGVDRTQTLALCVAVCTRALASKGLSHELFFAISQTKANTLVELGRSAFPDGQEYYEEAIATGKTVLAALSLTKQEHGRVALHRTLTTVYRAYAECRGVDRPGLLKLALAESDALFARIDKRNDPMGYARQLMNRANLCDDLAETLDTDQRGYNAKAISFLEKSLLVRTALLVPLEYAWSQHNLAVAYKTQANLVPEKRRESLQRARTAMAEALKYRTPAEVPTHAVLSEYMMATILLDSADATTPTDRLYAQYVEDGIAHCMHARTIAAAIPDTFTHAATYDIHAGLLCRRARIAGQPRAELLGQAIETVEVALRFYTENDYTDDLGETLLTHATILLERDGATESTIAQALRGRALTRDARAPELTIRALLVYAEIAAASADETLKADARHAATDARALAKRLGHGVHLHRAEALITALKQR